MLLLEIQKFQKKISKWKIKINSEVKNDGNIDICIGISSNQFKGSYYNEFWNICKSGSKIGLNLKNKSSYLEKYQNKLKKDDIVEVIVDRKLGNLSFSINDFDCGIVCSDIPKEENLYPTIVLYEKNLIIEKVK